MKNIKYIAILVFQCALLQFTFGQQSTDNNGRPVDAKPGVVVKTDAPTVAKDVPNKGAYNIDLDVPGCRQSLHRPSAPPQDAGASCH